jgi:hypothetical protein
LLRCLQALIALDEVVPVKQLAAGEAAVMSGQQTPRMRAEERVKNKETRIGGGAAIRVSGECGWGDPHFSHFTGSTHHSSAGTVGNRTSCHQGIRRGRATRYLMHAVRRSGLAGPLAAGLGEPDDDGERGCRKSDVAGGQGGHFCRSSAGPRPHVTHIEAPRFWMMSSNVSGLFRWGCLQRHG